MWGRNSLKWTFHLSKLMRDKKKTNIHVFIHWVFTWQLPGHSQYPMNLELFWERQTQNNINEVPLITMMAINIKDAELRRKYKAMVNFHSTEHSWIILQNEQSLKHIICSLCVAPAKRERCIRDVRRHFVSYFIPTTALCSYSHFIDVKIKAKENPRKLPKVMASH